MGNDVARLSDDAGTPVPESRRLHPAAALRAWAAAGSGDVVGAPAARVVGVSRSVVAGYCLTVFFTGVVVSVLVLRSAPAQGSADPAVAWALLALALFALVVGVLIAQQRHQPVTTWGLHSVWLLGAALLLPYPVAAALTALLLVHALRVRGASLLGGLTYWGAAALGVVAARASAGWVEPVLTVPRVLLAALVMFAVQGGTVLVLAWMTQVPHTARALFGDPPSPLAELTGLSLGALLVVALRVDPMLALLVAPAMVLVQSSFQVPLLRRSAQLDAKTGLQSTEHWHRQATDRLATARQRGLPAAVVLIDVDRFKRVNDSVGHLAGDAVLAAIAAAAAAQLRGGDVIGRFGGDEIAALLSSATAEQAVVVGDRMRAAVHQISVPTRGVSGTALTVDGLTVSVGVAGSDEQGHQLADLLLAADGALLEAKRSGRNRVCTA